LAVTGGSSFHNLENLFEFRIGGGAQKFKQNHFCTGEMRLGTFYCRYAAIAIFIKTLNQLY